MALKSQEEETLKLIITSAQVENIEGKNSLTQSNLQNSLNNQLGENNFSITSNNDGTFLVSSLESHQDYLVSSNNFENYIDWNDIMVSAVAPEEQVEERNKNVIGIGTDGKTVNMDFWKYSLLEDGSFILNESSSSNTAGYIGPISSETGSIIGTIPQYISIDNGMNFKPVTSLRNTFRNCSSLTIAPKIPSTINNMICTFSQTGISVSPLIPSSVKTLAWCFEITPLIETPILPEGVIDIHGIFSGCSQLTTLTPFPNSIETIYYAFANCTSLQKVPDDFSIPSKVVDIHQMFTGCSNLTSLPTNFTITNNISDIRQTFSNCSKLEGTIILDTTPDKYINCFQNLEKYGKLKVNYTINCTNIDRILNYDTTLKGSLIQ